VSAAGIGVYQRMFPIWDIYFAVATVAVMIGVLVTDDVSVPRRVGAVAAIAGIAVVYAFAGRELVRRYGPNRRAIIVLTAETILFAVAVGLASFSTYLLFAVLPMIFLAVPMGVAFWYVIAVNLVPVAFGLFTAPGDTLVHLAPIAVVSTAFALWLGFWVSRVVDQSIERGDLIAELEQSRAEVARLSHEAGVSAERARLAGEIHDTLAQGFTSIITLLQAADPELRDERLALAVRTAKENLAESRALVAALSPSALASASLPDAVRRQASRFTDESGVPATVRVTGEERELSTATEVVLLRATQEALTNIRRHADARAVGVLLAYGETTVRLVIRDDGCGANVQNTALGGVQKGFGLVGMRARAEQVAGALRVKSDPGHGTTIELEVPA
jgi:signal transduction histidine kinase